MFGKKKYSPEELEQISPFLVARRGSDKIPIFELDAESFPNAFSVGTFLVDIARHYARTKAETDADVSYEGCLHAVLDGFVTEAEKSDDFGADRMVS